MSVKTLTVLLKSLKILKEDVEITRKEGWKTFLQIPSATFVLTKSAETIVPLDKQSS